MALSRQCNKCLKSPVLIETVLRVLTLGTGETKM